MIRSCKPVIVLLGALTALDLAAAVLASRVTERPSRLRRPWCPW